MITNRRAALLHGRAGDALAARRARFASSAIAVDLAGDWLDGVASESALRTGEQAAARVARRLGV